MKIFSQQQAVNFLKTEHRVTHGFVNTIVSLIRKKQFALINPATKTRIDLGLKLVGKDLTQRLENSGPFGAMCTHRVQLTKVEEVDAELKAWLTEAYDKAN